MHVEYIYAHMFQELEPYNVNHLVDYFHSKLDQSLRKRYKLGSLAAKPDA